MDIQQLLELLVLIMFYIVLMVGLWVILRYKKEEMQSNLFLRYKYVQRNVVTFVIALIIYLTLNSLDNIGYPLAPQYHIILDFVALILLIISVYDLKFKVARQN